MTNLDQTSPDSRLADCLENEHYWRQVRRSSTARNRGALFLDRDGTIIDHVHYIRHAADVKLITDAIPLIRAAHRAELAVVVITNQSAIGRGMFGWSEFLAVEDRMNALLAEQNCAIDAVYACADVPDPTVDEISPYRKPAPGMILDAITDLLIDPAQSWIVGDNVTDLEAGKRAGLRRGWLAPTGHGERDADAAVALAGDDFDVVVGHSVDELAGLIAADT